MEYSGPAPAIAVATNRLRPEWATGWVFHVKRRCAKVGRTRVAPAGPRGCFTWINLDLYGPATGPFLAGAPLVLSRTSARHKAWRWGIAVTLIGAALFLATDASAYCTGTTITLDGGVR